MGFQEMIRTLESYGLTDVLLPFILIFTIVYAVLHKTKILGDGRKNYNVIISLVMAFSVIIPHVLGTYPRGADVVDIINKALPSVSVVLVGILMIMIMLGIFGHNISLAGNTLGGWFVLLAILIVVAIFGNAAGWFNLRFFDWLTVNSDTRNLLVMILIFGIIISFITKEDRTDKTQNFLGRIGDMFGGLVGGKK